MTTWPSMNGTPAVAFVEGLPKPLSEPEISKYKEHDNDCSNPPDNIIRHSVLLLQLMMSGK
jgi:hypothetical protein